MRRRFKQGPLTFMCFPKAMTDPFDHPMELTSAKMSKVAMSVVDRGNGHGPAAGPGTGETYVTMRASEYDAELRSAVADLTARLDRAESDIAQLTAVMAEGAWTPHPVYDAPPPPPPTLRRGSRRKALLTGIGGMFAMMALVSFWPNHQATSFPAVPHLDGAGLPPVAAVAPAPAPTAAKPDSAA